MKTFLKSSRFRKALFAFMLALASSGGAVRLSADDAGKPLKAIPVPGPNGTVKVYDCKDACPVGAQCCRYFLQQPSGPWEEQTAGDGTISN